MRLCALLSFLFFLLSACGSPLTDTSDNPSDESQIDHTCGNDTCEEGEAEICPGDCMETGNDCPPDMPVDCGDDCWVAGTDCRSRIFECDGNDWRCLEGYDYASCCEEHPRGDKLFSVCREEYAHFCPSKRTCFKSKIACSLWDKTPNGTPSSSAFTCTFHNEPCFPDQNDDVL